MKEEATVKPKVGFFPTNAHPYSWQSLICTWFIWALNSFDYQLVCNSSTCNCGVWYFCIHLGYSTLRMDACSGCS